MRHLAIHCAEQHRDRAGVEPTTIVIAEVVPDFTGEDSLQRAAVFYRVQGSHLADALHSALPGGTLDALLAELLAKRASLLRVRFPEVLNAS